MTDKKGNALRRGFLGMIKALAPGSNRTAAALDTVKPIRRPDGNHIERLLNDWTEKSSNISEDFTMETLATAIGVRRRSLADYFGKIMKKDFRLWKSELKIELSKSMLLQDENLDISEICDAIGFRNRACFHKHFKTVTGCTPMHWRRTGGHPELK